jgi:hypothetical protein
MAKGTSSKQSQPTIAGLTRHKRVTMWVTLAVAAGLISYGAWLGANISLG